MATLKDTCEERTVKDYWTSEAYTASASFVPALATAILSWLEPTAEDIILDLGCGDGVLTAQIASKSRKVIGLDSSRNLIQAAKDTYIAGDNNVENLEFEVQDCRELETVVKEGSLQDGSFTKIFSNAALHWILPHHDPVCRLSIFRGAYGLLRPGGVLVFEMGGHGNVAEIHTALISAVIHRGASPNTARAASPWFFPSEDLMVKELEEVGFEVEKAETEYRPTPETKEKEGGLQGWVKLMGAQFLEALPNKDLREAAIQEVCEVLESICGREEGGYWLGYVRLRIRARKP